MPTIKKQSKAKVNELACKDLEKISSAIKSGAKLVEERFWKTTEYSVQFPEGGRFRITKRIYDKLMKIENEK